MGRYSGEETNIAGIYATLVGRVDSMITVLEHMAEQKNFDWYHIRQVTEMLKAALLEAEEKYIEAGEEADYRLIILPHSTTAPQESADQAHPQE